MLFNQIATLLNNTLVPNVFGGDSVVTIAEDLSNVVDLGTKIANIDGDTLKTYLKDSVVGIFDTYVDTRSYKDETYGLFLSEIEYGGALQRVKAKLGTAQDTDILTLVNANTENAPDYYDGKYYGAEWDSALYTKDSGFMIPWSLSTTMYKRYFTDAAGVQKLIAMIEANIDTQLKVELNTLARGVLRKLILSAYTGSRYIPVLTTYNNEMGFTSSDAGYVTVANFKQSEAFKIWCQELVLKLRKYVTDINTKYNNGDVYTFCPETDSRCVILTEFATSLEVAKSNVFHDELVDGLGEYRTINYWQNPSKDLMPHITAADVATSTPASVHDQVKEITVPASGQTPATVVTIDHVMGVFYDKYSAFICDKLDKTTSGYIPKGDFISYFHNVVKSYQIDPRNTAIALVLA